MRDNLPHGVRRPHPTKATGPTSPPPEPTRDQIGRTVTRTGRTIAVIGYATAALGLVATVAAVVALVLAFRYR